jgi:hypothetical protein
MSPALRALLHEVIDYAGQFPPAALSLADASAEFQAIMGSPDRFWTRRFIVKAPQLSELSGTLQETPLAIVARPAAEGLRAQLTTIVDEIAALVEEDGHPESLEIAIPPNEAALKEALGVMKKRADDLAGTQVYFELGWGDDLPDLMSEAASTWEDVGFKARTGGVTASEFPSPDRLAEFLHMATSLDLPYKLTAGLHDPLTHPDEALGVMRFGFLNALGAAALARSEDLSVREVHHLLLAEDVRDGASGLSLGDLTLDESAVNDFRSVFGGFGSCSVAEPRDGLAAFLKQNS